MIDKELLIGKNTQLSYFWESKIDIISSYNIDVDNIRKQKYDKIYIAFAEGRTFLPNASFYDINYNYTLNLIDKIKNYCGNIVYYSTTELWNRYSGPIGEIIKNGKVTFEYDNSSSYIYSKDCITRKIIFDENYENVIVVFPFSFNSAFRKTKEFLFSKIFDSIINKKKVVIGNVNYYRELLHPKFVVKESIGSKQHKIIGSGRVVHVGDFIKKLYRHFNLQYEELVSEENNCFNGKKNIYYLDSKECLYNEQQLFENTIEDIEKILWSNRK